MYKWNTTWFVIYNKLFIQYLYNTYNVTGSESEGDDDDDSSDIFYSTYGSRMKMPQKYKLTTDKEESYLTLNLQIARGLLCLFTPVRDASGNNVIPGQQAEFLVNVENASFFMVNGYKDDPDLVYLCSEVQKAQLYHCGKSFFSYFVKFFTKIESLRTIQM